MALSFVLIGNAHAAKKNGKVVAAPAKKMVKAPSNAPNVLFILADDLNDWIGWMGGHPQARTPNMDRLAKMGMRFTNAHCNFALCNPSRTSLLTGQLPSTSGVFGNEQDWRQSVRLVGRPTLPQYFRENGFLTAAGGKVFHANHGGPEGRLAGWHGGRRGFEQDVAWEERFPSPGVQIPDLPIRTGRNFNGLNIWHWDWGGIPVTDEETDDGQVVSWASAFLSAQQTKPFFLTVGLYRPHSPWYVPEKYLAERPLSEVILPEVKADDLDDLPPVAKAHSVRADSLHRKVQDSGLWKSAVRAYLANISFCDAMVGRLLTALEMGPHAKNTVIIFSSDHGWYLGEKQMWHKGMLWEEATRIPLTIFAPGVTKPDTVSAQPVSLLDLFPTVCDLGHLKQPEELDGESLVPLLEDPTLVRNMPIITASGGGGRASYAARDQRWRYIRYFDGTEELYDHQNDPNEWVNLASMPEHAEVKKSLGGWMPTSFASASRSLAEVAPGHSPDGRADYRLQAGDRLSGEDVPVIKGKGVFIEATVDFNPDVDRDSSILSQGDTRTGYALHFVDAQPTLTVFDQGKKAAVALGVAPKGSVNLRAIIGPDGTLSMSMSEGGEISGSAPFEQVFTEQPKADFCVGGSFGPLTPVDYPNSTPYDGGNHRLRLTLFNPLSESPSVIPAAVPVDDGAPSASPTQN